MVALLFTAPAGVPGDITRQQASQIESGLFNVANAPTAFGAPVKLVSGKFEKIAASDAATVFVGVLTRVAPSMSNQDGSPVASAVHGIMRKGYINVLCTIGTPVKGGIVYMRVTAATGKAVGDFEATADGANNVALTRATWAVDGKDANNVAEIRID